MERSIIGESELGCVCVCVDCTIYLSIYIYRIVSVCALLMRCNCNSYFWGVYCLLTSKKIDGNQEESVPVRLRFQRRQTTNDKRQHTNIHIHNHSNQQQPIYYYYGSTTTIIGSTLCDGCHCIRIIWSHLVTDAARGVGTSLLLQSCRS